MNRTVNAKYAGSNPAGGATFCIGCKRYSGRKEFPVKTLLLKMRGVFLLVHGRGKSSWHDFIGSYSNGKRSGCYPDALGIPVWRFKSSAASQFSSDVV